MGSFKVIIVGSGLAGNLLANGLINNNIEVEVYERLAITAKREGYQIRLGEHALKGFRACLTEEQKNLIVSKFGRASGSFASAPILYDRNFRPLLDLNKFPNYEKSAPISRKILRDLLAAPVENAGRLFYDKSFKSYKVMSPGTPHEKIRVILDDDTSSDCDILVAADGSHSKINTQIGLNNLVELDTHWNFLAKSDLPTKRYLDMSDELVRSPVGCWSRGRGMYYCAYLPDRQGTESARPAKPQDLKRNPRFDDSISSCFFGYAIPVQDCPPEVKEWSVKKQWDYIKSDMQRHWSPKFQEIVELLQDSDLYCYQGRASTRPPANWRQKVRSLSDIEKGHPRVMVMGDAIHAMMPTRGMGGNQSLRDTTALLPVLLDLSNKSKVGSLSSEDVENACKTYEDEMIPRAFEWVAKSGGTKGFSIDSDTWAGYLTTIGFSLALNVAYYLRSILSPFQKVVHVEEAPELLES